MSHPVVMIRRKAMLAVGKYRDIVSEDADLFLRLAEHGRLANLPEVLLKYRIPRGQPIGWRVLPKSGAPGLLADDPRRAKTAESPAGIDSTRAGDRRNKRHQQAGDLGLVGTGAGHVRTARKYAVKVLAGAPFSSRAWRFAYCAVRGY